DMLGAAGEDLTGLRGRALLPEYTMMAPAPSRPASIPVTCVPSPADRKCSCPAPRPTGAPPTPRSAALHGAVGCRPAPGEHAEGRREVSASGLALRPDPGRGPSSSPEIPVPVRAPGWRRA